MIHRISGFLILSNTLVLLSGVELCFAKPCYVKQGAASHAGSSEQPYGNYAQVEQDKSCSDIYVLASANPLEGPITLRPGQKLIGLGDSPSITNTKNKESGVLPVITLADNNLLKNLNIISLGVGIFADNVTGTRIEDVKVVKLEPYAERRSPLSWLSKEVCRIMRYNDGEIDMGKSVLRGCDFFSFAFSKDGVPSQKAGIVFLADDKGAHRQFTASLYNVRIQDIDLKEANKKSPFWGSALLVQTAGGKDINFALTLKSVSAFGSFRGYEFQARGSSSLKVQASHLLADDLWGDAFLVVTGFYCSSEPRIGMPCLTYKVPKSNEAKIVVHLEDSAFLHSLGYSQRFLDGQGIETVATEPGGGVHEVHVQNTTIKDQIIGFFVFNGWGYPKKYIYDLGCINPHEQTTPDPKSCAAQGYTSLGGNRIFNNGAGTDKYPEQPFQTYEVSIKGKGHVMAQNNYWGGISMWGFDGGRLTDKAGTERKCQLEFSEVGRELRRVFPVRCQINDPGEFSTGVGTLNDDFPLENDPIAQVPLQRVTR